MNIVKKTTEAASYGTSRLLYRIPAPSETIPSLQKDTQLQTIKNLLKSSTESIPDRQQALPKMVIYASYSSSEPPVSVSPS